MEKTAKIVIGVLVIAIFALVIIRLATPRYEGILYAQAVHSTDNHVNAYNPAPIVTGTVVKAIYPQFDWAEDFSGGLARIRIGGLYGVIDTAGSVIAEPQFDSVQSFSEGLAAVRIGDWDTGLWGFIDTNGNVIVEPQFDSVQSFSEGLAVVRIGDWDIGRLWGFIRIDR